MSMEHKAFLFYLKRYHEEIEPIIKKCCGENGDHYAVQYIEQHYKNLKSPYLGDQLDAMWHDEIERDTIQEYIDFILTACYEPDEDIGLGYAWEALYELLEKLDSANCTEKWILGSPLEYNGIIVDPGYMGLGIIESREVSDIKKALFLLEKKIKKIVIHNKYFCDYTDEEIINAYYDLCDIYKIAEERQLGIMMTF